MKRRATEDPFSGFAKRPFAGGEIDPRFAPAPLLHQQRYHHHAPAPLLYREAEDVSPRSSVDFMPCAPPPPQYSDDCALLPPSRFGLGMRARAPPPPYGAAAAAADPWSNKAPLCVVDQAARRFVIAPAQQREQPAHAPPHGQPYGGPYGQPYGAGPLDRSIWPAEAGAAIAAWSAPRDWAARVTAPQHPRRYSDLNLVHTAGHVFMFARCAFVLCAMLMLAVVLAFACGIAHIGAALGLLESPAFLFCSL